MAKRLISVRLAGLVLVAGLIVGTAGYLQANKKPTAVAPPTAGSAARLAVYQEEFLTRHDLKVEGPAETFSVRVPKSWVVKLGEYPAGLYWTLANEFSKDAGLDLAELRGQTVDVYRYRLSGGLPGEGEQARFSYPSNVVLLTAKDRVVGAWLEFNTTAIGPSVRRRGLENITGLTFGRWVEREGLFADMGPNGDLASLDAPGVVKAFFEAINARDRARANACLSPRVMLSTLTGNRRDRALYNPDFGRNNSLVANIVRGRLLSWKPYDPGLGRSDSSSGAERPEMVGLAAQVELWWRDQTFNTPGGRATRFFILTRSKLGWKIEDMGTGP